MLELWKATGKLVEASDLIEAYEGARFHELRLKEFGDKLDQPIANLVVNVIAAAFQRRAEDIGFLDSVSRFRTSRVSWDLEATQATAGTKPFRFSISIFGRLLASRNTHIEERPPALLSLPSTCAR